ncbi:hypothetical protein [Streptomyces dysideae]|uniref:Uncharacterized protein n=1 Tax=Streptomyces dysideae TaxID=909626 RepID=A0A101UR05_9ACTN|nr:hypothetical protein [Streptomyces dysideae]KUO15195.1 hypothetical protein AQJ91_42305 [Streptomyces dysideae]
MPPPRWLAFRRRLQPEATRTVEPESRTPLGPQGPWLTDPDFSARLHSATLTLLDLVEDVMHDDFTLTEAIDGFRYHAADLLNIPDQYGILVEADAAAQIVQAAGKPAGPLFGPTIAQGLARIETLPIEDQENLVRAAARRYATTEPSRRPARTRQVPTAPRVQPPRRTR